MPGRGEKQAAGRTLPPDRAASANRVRKGLRNPSRPGVEIDAEPTPAAKLKIRRASGISGTRPANSSSERAMNGQLGSRFGNAGPTTLETNFTNRPGEHPVARTGMSVKGRRPNTLATKRSAGGFAGAVDPGGTPGLVANRPGQRQDHIEVPLGHEIVRSIPTAARAFVGSRRLPPAHIDCRGSTFGLKLRRPHAGLCPGRWLAANDHAGRGRGVLLDGACRVELLSLRDGRGGYRQAAPRGMGKSGHKTCRWAVLSL